LKCSAVHSSKYSSAFSLITSRDFNKNHQDQQEVSKTLLVFVNSGANKSIQNFVTVFGVKNCQLSHLKNHHKNN